ncbi:MAG: TetR/AcrR family transcriptional regulator [Acetatifactor sp.]|nr:TetR/AcrR family transcriptional regulator [Acetatifactor sp.]
MNDSFFDIEKEKQERIINAALKAFSLQGYKHASTDEIAKEANVSKGLIFHYFDSKVGLYSFVFSYSVKYMVYFLNQAVNPKETDFFMLLRQITCARMYACKKYKYIQLFLESCPYEDVTEALLATEGEIDILNETYDRIYSQVDRDKFKSDVVTDDMIRFITLSFSAMLREEVNKKSFQADQFYKETLNYIDMLNKLMSKN